MKKIIQYTMLLFAAIMMIGCQDEPLVFDHEKPQFELNPDAILLEVIVPSGTAVDEQIYITGAFNGGQEYLLEKAANSDKKWGIYLFDTDFVDGKSLKDGFYFVSKKNGASYDVKGAKKEYTLDVTYGSRTNVWIDRWESYYKQDNPGEIVPGKYEHLYATGNIEGSSWDPANPIEFTMVGTDIFRAEITFTETTSYFAISTGMGDWDTFNAGRYGASDALLMEGTALKLQPQEGSDQCVTIAAGTYTLTVNMVTLEIVIGEGDWTKPEKPGKYEALYATGNIEGSSWDPSNPIIFEKVGRDLFRSELTFVPADGNDICYFALGTAKGDWDSFNGARWGAGNALLTADTALAIVCDGTEQCITIAPGTYTITVNMIFKEIVIGEGDWSGRVEPEEEEPSEEPGDEPVVVVPDTITTRLYFLDATAVDSLAMTNVYSWGNDDQKKNQEIFGGWPGVNWKAWNKVNFLGQTFYYYEFRAVEGQVCNLIINGAGSQYDACSFTVGEKTDLYYEIGDASATQLVATAAGIQRRR